MFSTFTVQQSNVSASSASRKHKCEIHQTWNLRWNGISVTDSNTTFSIPTLSVHLSMRYVAITTCLFAKSLFVQSLV